MIRSCDDDWVAPPCSELENYLASCSQEPEAHAGRHHPASRTGLRSQFEAKLLAAAACRALPRFDEKGGRRGSASNTGTAFPL